MATAKTIHPWTFCILLAGIACPEAVGRMPTAVNRASLAGNYSGCPDEGILFFRSSQFRAFRKIFLAFGFFQSNNGFIGTGRLISGRACPALGVGMAPPPATGRQARKGANIMPRTLFGLVFLSIPCPLVEAQEPAKVLKVRDYVSSLAFSPNGKTLACATGAEIQFWTVSDGKPRSSIQTLTRFLAFLPDGKTLVGGGAQLGGHCVRFFSVVTGNQKAVLEFPTPIRSIAVSPDGKMIASSGSELEEGKDLGMAKVWDVSTKKELATLRGQGRGITAVGFVQIGDAKLLKGIIGERSKPGKRKPGAEKEDQGGRTFVFATGGGDGSIKLWDCRNWKEISSFNGHKRGVYCLAFSPSGKFLASAGGEKTVILWDMAQEEEPVTLHGHKDPVNAIAFSPDGKLLASGSSDRTVRLWDVSTGKERAKLEGHADYVVSLAFSPDGRLLASGSLDKTINLWEVSKVFGQGK